jgi:hypothetical protein
MTGILHLLNQTPIHWFSKKQSTVETATYGSEFVAAKQSAEQIIDLKYTLRMLGIPIDGPAWMFGDNQSVVTSSTLPHSSLNKRHNALAYHRVREAIAAGIVYFMHVPGKYNVSDIFTKFLPWADFWPLVQPLLFWKGETMKSIDKNLPISEIVAHIKEESSKGLWGVTSGNDKDATNSSSFPCLKESTKIDSVKESPRQVSKLGSKHDSALKRASLEVKDIIEDDLKEVLPVEEELQEDIKQDTIQAEVLEVAAEDQHDTSMIGVRFMTTSLEIGNKEEKKITSYPHNPK